jgi:hypothetical protein
MMTEDELRDVIARCEESKMFFGMARGESTRASRAATGLVSQIAHGLVAAQCSVYAGDALMRISLLRIKGNIYVDTVTTYFAPALDCALRGRDEADSALAQIIAAEESGTALEREAQARAEVEIEAISSAISILIRDVNEQIHLLKAERERLRERLQRREIERDAVKNSMGPMRWAAQRGDSDRTI